MFFREESYIYFNAGSPSGPVPEGVVGEVVINEPSPPSHPDSSATHPADPVSTASTTTFGPQDVHEQPSEEKQSTVHLDVSPGNLELNEGMLFLN